MKRRALTILIPLVGMALCLGLMAVLPGNDRVDAMDSAQFLNTAYHLDRHGVFAESYDMGEPDPGIGREPGYPAFLWLLRQISPELQKVTPECLTATAGCGRELYTTAIWANRGLLAVSGLLTFFAVLSLTGSLSGASAAGFHLWLNEEIYSWHDYMLSDFLAIFLMAVALCGAVWARRARSVGPWIIPALAWAGLVLTKAIFFYVTLVSFVLLLPLLAWWVFRRRWRPIAAAVLVVAVVAAPVGGWMARNAALTGQWAVTPDFRSGMSLSFRAQYLTMTPEQIVAYMVFKTRGFGDDLARTLYPENVLAPMSTVNREGYYLGGELDYAAWVSARMNEGMSRRAAMEAARGHYLGQLASQPGWWAATTVPQVYAGLWIDLFVLFSFPALIWLSLKALRRGDLLLLGIAVTTWGALTAYAAVTYAIPRYQMTALPGLSIATGMAVAALVAWRRRRGAEVTPVAE